MFEAVSDLHFLRPWWLLAIIPVLGMALYWSRRRGSGSHWEAQIEPHLLEVLLEPGARRRSRTVPWLAALALALGAAGLAGPTWERLPQPVERKTDALVIAFDLSLSMFAEDVAPSRLVRARQKVADVLRRRDEGFTALVAYAGDAHAVVPLTDDTRTIENLLTALRPDMMPVLGSNLASALEQAHVLFDNAGMRQGRILVITDGVDEIQDVLRYQNRSFPISILGVGTAAGAHIPLDFLNQPGQVLRSQQGNPIVARLDAERLQNVAGMTYGRYRTLSLADSDIDALLATALPGEDETVEVERDFDSWADMGFWVAVALLPFVLGIFRRGVVALVPILLAPVVLMPAPAHAGFWEDLWQRRDQQGYQALTEGQPETAASLFEQEDWRAAALYRSGAFDLAAQSYRQQGESLDATYNLGNALAHQGRYQAAIDTYDAVLAQNPEHEDARFNKALVEKLLEEQSQGDQDDDARQQPGGEQPEDQAPPQGDSDTDQDTEDSTDGTEPPDGAPEDQEAQRSEPDASEQPEAAEEMTASRDEQRDALEQWLRRVPDDPGGLLRRKFQYETNQRLRRGDYRSQETEKIW